MTQVHTLLTDLDPADRAELEHRLVAFDLSWRAGTLPDEIDRLPEEAAWRWAAVVEFVKVDLERSWRAGNRLTLEDYLRTVPDLGAPADLPVDLIAVEYQLRKDFGDPAAQTDLPRRFPAQAAQVQRIINEAVETSDQYEKAGRTERRIVPGRGPARNGEAFPSGSFGRYRIVRLLGRGGMGAVYLAHDPQLQRDVALKIPSAELTADPRAIEFVLREARAAAGLRHANICPVYDAGVIDGTPFITSLFIEGEPLSALANRTPPVSRGAAAKLVATVARALDHAHRNGIIHRDLKPSNIMVDRAGQPVVTDFGLARRVQPDQPSLAAMSGLAGSPAYMAPEQVAETKAGPASDIFSLGVVLYELLTGRVPFQGTPHEVLHQVVHRACPRPSSVRPDLDPRLEAICLKALAKDPHERYQSMGEMAKALEAYSPRSTWQRRRVLAAVGCVLIAASGVVFVVGGLGERGWFGAGQKRAAPPGDGGSEVGQSGPLQGQPRVPVVPKDEPFQPAFMRVADFNPALFQPPPFKGEKPATPQEWVAALDDPNESNRYLAVLEVARTKNKAAIPALARRMTLPVANENAGEHFAVRRECAAALGYLGEGNKEAEDALVVRIADAIWKPARAVNKADWWRNPFVGGIAKDPENAGKGAALEALNKIAPGRVTEALDAAKKSPNAEVKKWATR